jgi:hypothetical protein
MNYIPLFLWHLALGFISFLIVAFSIDWSQNNPAHQDLLSNILLFIGILIYLGRAWFILIVAVASTTLILLSTRNLDESHPAKNPFLVTFSSYVIAWLIQPIYFRLFS